jgi:hypothetical protein
VPDRCGEGEDPLADPGGGALDAARAVTFEVELVFEGVVDRFDELADGLEQVLAGPRRTIAVRRAQQGGAAVGQCLVEFAGGVALVGDDRLAGAVGK